MRRPGGFTLIELMIVVAVVAILAMIAIPKMADLIRKGNEAAAVGHMGAMRSAIHIYFLDNDEFYPTNVEVLLKAGNKYYNGGRPEAYTLQHGRSVVVNQLAALDPIADTGAWGYVSGGIDRGTFWAQCLHKDMKNKVWSQY
jgi:prepilin-type N-terminal cleavage/methylation domain-containing protein